MYSFPTLIKKIREEADLTQEEFGKALGVSTILIAMIETEKKEVSKRFLSNLAEKMNVHPASITPFLFVSDDDPIRQHSAIEKRFAKWGEQMQNLLIKDRAKLLKKHG